MKSQGPKNKLKIYDVRYKDHVKRYKKEIGEFVQ